MAAIGFVLSSEQFHVNRLIDLGVGTGEAINEKTVSEDQERVIDFYGRQVLPNVRYEPMRMEAV